MPKQPYHFGTFATAATQREIDHPAFKDCVENWRKRFARMILVVDRNTTVPAIRGLRWFKIERDRVMLKDVIRRAVETTGVSDGVSAIGTPLLRINSRVLEILPVLEKRQLGKAWAATSVAISLDETMGAGEFEDDGLRFFMACEGVWASLLRHIKDDPPFTDPLWGGVVATHLSRRVQTNKYFDITSLKAVGNVDKPKPFTADAGYGDLTFNPPTHTFFKEPVVA